MGPYERRRRGNSCRRDTRCRDAKGNTWRVQRGPGYLAAPGPAPGSEPGQAVVLKSRSEFRMQTTGERGVHEPAFKLPRRWAGSGRTSQGQNRTREIRPSGIAGGRSSRQGRNPAGESPAVPIARFRHVAMPQLMLGNRMSPAWCKRPGRPVDFEPQRWVQPGGLASIGA